MKRVVLAGGIRIEYVLVQTVRKSISLRALPGEYRVYAPKAMRLRDIDDVVREHAAELVRMRTDVEAAVDAQRVRGALADGMPVTVEGRPRTLRLHEGSFRYTLTDTALEVWQGNSEDAREAVRRALAELSVVRFTERLRLYAPLVGVSYGRVTIREQRTRWGSCSAKGNLNFNWKLIMAPPEALDYVVVHELCHRLEFNHSPRFWSLVEKQLPEYDFWRRWLKDHGSELSL